MLKVQLNNYELDLFENEQVHVTFQVNDVFKLGTQQGDFSRRFKIPKTKNNLLAIERIHYDSNFTSQLSNDPPSHLKRLPAQIEQNGMQIVTEGIGVLNSITNDDIELTIYARTYDLFKKMGDDTLQDLDLSAHDFDLTVANVKTRMNATTNVMFAVINYGRLPVVGHEIDLRYFHHSFVVSDLITEISTHLGRTISNNLGDSSSLIVPFVNDEYLSTGTPTVPKAYLSTNNQTLTKQVNTKIGYNTETSDTDGVYDATTNYKYTLSKAFYGTCAASVRVYTLTGTITFKLRIVSDVKGTVAEVSESITNNWFAPGGIRTVRVDTGFLLWEENEIIHAEAYYIQTSTGAITTVGIVHNTHTRNPGADTFMEFNISNKAAPGGNSVDVAANMPFMKISDFIKGLLNMMNTHLVFNTATRNYDPVQILSMREKTDMGTFLLDPLDWSSRVDVSRPVEMSFPQSYPSRNYLWYAQDPLIPAANNQNHEEFYQRGGSGNYVGLLDLSDEVNFSEDKDIVVLPFAPCTESADTAAAPNYLKVAEDDISVCHIEKYYLDDNDIVQQNTGLFPRILRRYSESDHQVQLTDGYATPTTDTISAYKVGEFGNADTETYHIGFHTLGSGDGLTQNAWRGFYDMIQQKKAYKVYMRLTERDVVEYNWKRVIELQVSVEDVNLNGLFYLNKIIEFRESGKSTQVELVKMY